jgi:polysaccharide biosynthesis protein PslG
MPVVRAAAATIVLAVLALGAGSGCGSSDGEETGPLGEPPEPVTIGVVPQRPFDGYDTSLIRAAGMDSLRLWLWWGEIEQEPGQYVWAPFDFRVAAAAQAELRVLPYVFAVPVWVARLDGHQCGEHCVTYAPSSTGTRAAFAAFARAAVERYGPDGAFWAAHPELPYLPIQSWEIWNEQNSPVFFRPRVDPGSYAAVLAAVAPGIRAADPDAEILLGGMASLRDTRAGVVAAARYLSQLYAIPGITDSFDAIALHPYAGRVPHVFAQVDAARQATERAGDGRVPLWITELGWASAGRPSEHLVTTPEGQALALESAFGTLIDRREQYRLRGIYWYSWRDTDPGEAVCPWCAFSGLIDRDGQPKPAYEAMRTVLLARDLGVARP